MSICSTKNLTKGLVYYTDNKCSEKILKTAQEYIKKACGDLKIISVSLAPISFGENIVLSLKRGYLTMFKQILAGLEMLDTDIAFLVECDVLYNKEHFEFTPPTVDKFYYNEHVYQLDYKTGQAVFFYARRVSQLCAYRDLLVTHYRERVRKIEEIGRYTFRMGFEPGTHGRAERVDDVKYGTWWTEIPNIDIRHDTNLTRTVWDPSGFRNPCKGWKSTDEIPYWGVTKNKMVEFFSDLERNLNM